ncbi:hypothetical protein PUNSTDRAFT_131364 [Punctularia strigosozonata HHB-11173 SS5]|uniref:uncharacterized protein n=1 Tax=Punctularia strigosozonata (strain HHB-11173) TaxID=741275 RepID=UPI0004416C54|nr:uncharacterized protein PUNSTDRAFT_131364 [Punctularia strigosozonata HHB-11173 SS5]EIN11186.1 hypothetical protein PUNSTDRAFT_131364 [Punctularia strigosozonata HHB-11173 SS5]
MAPPTALQLAMASMFTESFFFGIYTVLEVVVVYILFARRRGAQKSLVALLYLSLFMYALVTTHMVLEVVQSMQTVVSLQNVQTRTIVGSLLSASGDCILIWRAWVVWSYNYWVIVIPVIAVLLETAFNFISSAAVSTSNSFTVFALPSSILTMVNNIICTALIAGRIGYMQWTTRKVLGKNSGTISARSYTGIMLLFIESGFIFTAVQIITVILDQIANPGIHVVINLYTPLMGLLPTLIIVLVHFEKVPGSHSTRQHESQQASGRTYVGSQLRFAQSGNTGATSITASRGPIFASGPLDSMQEYGGTLELDLVKTDSDLTKANQLGAYGSV